MCRRRKLGLVGLVVAAIIGLVVLVISVIPDVSEAERTRQLIVECVTPGPKHTCYIEGQKRTGAAVAAIVDTNGNGVPDVQDLANALGVSLPTTTTTLSPDG